MQDGGKGEYKETGGTEGRTGLCLFIIQGDQDLRAEFPVQAGEIDIIGYDGEYLVFFEVKYRSSDRKGSAAEAVGYAKQKRICRVADYYRAVHQCREDTPIRFDVVAVDKEQVTWIKDAFYYVARQS